MPKAVTALVTGSTRGIGAAIAAALTRRGCRVVRHGAQARQGALGADFLNAGAPEHLWEAALDRAGGRIDVLVNNAGVYAANPIEAPDIAWLEAWEDTLRVDLTAPAQLARLAVRQWLEDGCGGCLVNIAALDAHRGGSPDHWHFAAAKAGLLAMTKTIAAAYARQGVLAFAVCPGRTRPAGGEAAPEEAVIPLGRAATPEEIGAVAAFCALDAPASMTGAVLDTNGASYLR
jgi:NAD(P)-dependent dehydrogenase (short-subunit alcohol dehydrogenase family)